MDKEREYDIYIYVHPHNQLRRKDSNSVDPKKFKIKNVLA